MTPIYILYRAKHFKLSTQWKMEDTVSVYDVDRETHNFPSLKYYYSNIASMLYICIYMYTCLYSTCYAILHLYHTRCIYKSSMISKHIRICEFHMEWNGNIYDNSWREACITNVTIFFVIYSIILISILWIFHKKALLFENIQIFNSRLTSYNTFKSTTLCRSCARHLLLD